MTGKERAAFRAQANSLEPLFHIGKSGMNEGVIRQTDDALRARELIKVKVLLESGKFVTKRNIMKFVDYAIENTQKGGDMQIQVLIMNYRNEHFPDIDPLKSFKL